MVLAEAADAERLAATGSFEGMGGRYRLQRGAQAHRNSTNHRSDEFSAER